MPHFRDSHANEPSSIASNPLYQQIDQLRLIVAKVILVTSIRDQEGPDSFQRSDRRMTSHQRNRPKLICDLRAKLTQVKSRQGVIICRVCAEAQTTCDEDFNPCLGHISWLQPASEQAAAQGAPLLTSTNDKEVTISQSEGWGMC